ncbi:MAG TPA: hypothetical protein VIU40_14070 [Geobacteraceae bacterium]
MTTGSDTEERALTVVTNEPLDLQLAVNNDRMKQSMEAFHEFVKDILKVNVHYGKVPGVRKDFLWQSGAEEIFRAFNCRPTYSTVRSEIDAEKKWVLFWRKCEAIHIDTGTVVGEADAICSSEEFKNKDGKPGPFDKTLSNALMKADKRAMVKCARTLGCASEFFTQDEDMIDPGDSGGRPRSGGTARGTDPADPETGEIRPVGYWETGTDKDGNPVIRIMCKDHGWWFAREWGGRDGAPVTIKCMKKGTDGKYCQYQVPKNKAKPTAAPVSVSRFDKDELLRLLSERFHPSGETMKVADLAPIIGVEPPIKPSHIEAWLKANPKESAASLVKMAFLFHGGEENSGDDEVIEGEYSDPDDLPFE